MLPALAVIAVLEVITPALHGEPPQLSSIGKRTIFGTSVRTSSADMYSDPLLQFQPFPRLPIELRLKIWRHAMNEPRLIELEWGPDLSEITNSHRGSHQWHRVCPRSRQPPALLHTNQESRYEALLVYSLRSFDTPTSRFSDLVEQYIYRNNDVDVLFFGQKTCVLTLVEVFNSTHGQLGQPIKRVAIHMSGQIEQCCDMDDYVYGIDGGVDTMQALHGFDPEATAWDTRYGGCTGLKEVTFVVPTKLWPRKQGEINDKCILLPTESNGLTSGQASFKQRLLHYIGLVDSEAGIYVNQGQNIWVGDNKPTFSFASIRPLTVGNDLKVCDGMAVSKSEMRKLGRKNFEFFDKLQPRARCDVVVLPEEYPGEDPREIGLVSDKKGVSQAKDEILKFLVSLLYRFDFRVLTDISVGQGVVSNAGT
ncbi:hypothetical protein BDZ45DRAFT_262228 [Acephala macrosclerotiorum]|nr:hypothetical protein BDZ45DRAFT_262228 [Acephala macrosclerotiorum]